MAINVGDVVFNDYGEHPRVLHSRLVLAVVDQGTCEYVILTPDFDVYVEILDDSNPDLVGFHRAGPGGGLPRRLAGNVYGFAPMSAREYANFMAQGRAVADAEIAARGGVPVAPAAPVAAAVPPVAVPAGGAIPAVQAGANDVWVLCESIGSHKIGEQLNPPAGCPQLGLYGLMNMSDGEGNTRAVLMKKVAIADIPALCDERIRGGFGWIGQSCGR